MCVSSMSNNEVCSLTVTYIHPGHARGIVYTHDIRHLLAS